MNLTTLTDFVLADKYAGSPINMNKQYAKFQKQPLEKWMFVPCSKENGLPLSLDGLINSDGLVLDQIEFDEYQEAKNKVLFYSQHGVDELFDASLAQVFIDEFHNIEELANNIRGIKLTESAIKIIGL